MAPLKSRRAVNGVGEEVPVSSRFMASRRMRPGAPPPPAPGRPQEPPTTVVPLAPARAEGDYILAGPPPAPHAMSNLMKMKLATRRHA